MRGLKGGAIVSLLLILEFVLFTYLGVISIANLKRYPPTTECSYTDGMFNGNTTNYENFALVD